MDTRSKMEPCKIGNYICTLRKNKNLTQKELADKLGVTDKAISKWERGAGYPDISMLKPLAEILGTSVNELLEGETSADREEAEEREGEEDIHVNQVLEYANVVIKSREHNVGKIFSIILSVSLFLGVFVSAIVNLAVEGRLSWTYIVFGGCLLGGCLFVPPMLYKKEGFLVSLRFLTVLILPYLALIQYVSAQYTDQPVWLWNLGVPIALIWLFYLWLLVVLYKYKKIKFWIVAVIASILIIPGEIFTNILSAGYGSSVNMEDIMDFTILPSVFFCICLAGIFSLIGFFRQNKNRTE